MANPTWFDETFYLNGKLAQLKAVDPKGKLNDGKAWSSVDDVKAALKAAGYEGDEGLYQHFVDFGMDENISPNEGFDVMFYLQAKADALNAVHYEGKTNWDASSVMNAFKAAGIESAWEHYQLYGSSEGIATSADFDSAAYFVAKVNQLNDTGYDGRSNWTVDEVKAAFAEQGLTALEHYQLYGEDEKVATYDPDGKFAAATEAGDGGLDHYTGVTTYDTLQAALNAQAAGSLAENYAIADGGNVTVSVAQQAGIADLLAGATPAITENFKYTYTLVDTVEAIAKVSTLVMQGAAGYEIKDTLANITAAAEGTVVQKAAAVTVTDLGDNGITVKDIDNYVDGSDTGFVSAADALGTPWTTDSNDLLVATNDGDAIKTADLAGKLDWNGGDPAWKGTDEGFVKVLDGNFQNILEGGRGDDTLVGLDGAKDVFLFNSWNNAVTSAGNGGSVLGSDTIYNFEVGTDKLMVVSVYKSQMLGDKAADLGANTDMVAYDSLKNLAGITYDEKAATATVTIDGSFFGGTTGDDNLTITLVGVTEADVNAAGGLGELFMDAPSA